MQDKFYTKLENDWKEIPSGLGYRFIVRAKGDGGSAIVSQVTILPAGQGLVEVDLFALTDPKYFTDGVMNSIYEDITRFVRHYFHGVKEIRCSVTFGKSTINREWNVKKEIKARRLLWI